MDDYTDSRWRLTYNGKSEAGKPEFTVLFIAGRPTVNLENL